MNVYRSKDENKGYRERTFAFMIKRSLRFGFLIGFEGLYEL